MKTFENVRELMDRPPMYRCPKYFDKLSKSLAIDMGCSVLKVRHQIANDYGFTNYFDFCVWLEALLKQNFHTAFVLKNEFPDGMLSPR